VIVDEVNYVGQYLWVGVREYSMTQVEHVTRMATVACENIVYCSLYFVELLKTGGRIKIALKNGLSPQTSSSLVERSCRVDSDYVGAGSGH
jgi:hypothetical protein